MELSDFSKSIESIAGNVQAFGTKITDLSAKTIAMQLQLDTIDASSHQGGGRGGFATKSLAEEIFESEGFKALRESGGRGRFAIKVDNFQQKALTIAGSGSSTSGVMAIDRGPGILPIQFRQLRLRDVLRHQPTTLSICDYVRVSGFTNNASPQVEASAKQESTMTLDSVSVPVQTIAHYVQASRQILDDLPGLVETINSHLVYGLRLKEEQQLLNGSGTGVDLNGLVTQSTAFDVSNLPGPAYGWTRIDNIAAALKQAEKNDYSPDIVVLNSADFWAIAQTKDSFGRYILANPSSTPTVPTIWGKVVIVTNSMVAGTFLVGSTETALIRDRLEAIVEVSDSHDQNFVKNLLTIRCESRLTLQIYRPGAWVYGSFTTSPA
jgi:HK97 family phage major capsid protein